MPQARGSKLRPDPANLGHGTALIGYDSRLSIYPSAQLTSGLPRGSGSPQNPSRSQGGPIPSSQPGDAREGRGTGPGTELEAILPQALPAAGIRIFASQLHTHLAGRKVVTVLSRDGRERQVVNADGHYSPHFQVRRRAGGWHPRDTRSRGHRWVPGHGTAPTRCLFLPPLRRSAC